jgi:murein DD-endopeptidase MepM/ murein hydrolase activator NlpD
MKNRIKGIIIIRENVNTSPEILKVNGFIVFLFKLFMIITVLSALLLVLGWTAIIQRIITYEDMSTKNDSLILHSRQIDLLKTNLAKSNRFLEYFKMVSSFDGNGKSDLTAMTINDYLKDTVNVSPTLVADVQQEFRDIPRIRPVTGVISRGFDSSIPHEAIDFVASFRAPIRATADGIVTKVYFDDDLGRVVVLKHKDGYESLYAHCQEIIVKEGSSVVQGETIAFVGDSGKASKGIHLHYEVSKDGKAINPEQLFL